MEYRSGRVGCTTRPYPVSTASVSITASEATSTTATEFASKLATSSRLPSGVSTRSLGNGPTFTVPVTIRVATSSTATAPESPWSSTNSRRPSRDGSSRRGVPSNEIGAPTRSPVSTSDAVTTFSWKLVANSRPPPSAKATDSGPTAVVTVRGRTVSRTGSISVALLACEFATATSGGSARRRTPDGDVPYGMEQRAVARAPVRDRDERRVGTEDDTGRGLPDRDGQHLAVEVRVDDGHRVVAGVRDEEPHRARRCRDELRDQEEERQRWVRCPSPVGRHRRLLPGSAHRRKRRQRARPIECPFVEFTELRDEWFIGIEARRAAGDDVFARWRATRAVR